MVNNKNQLGIQSISYKALIEKEKKIPFKWINFEMDLVYELIFHKILFKNTCTLIYLQGMTIMVPLIDNIITALMKHD